MWQPGVNSHYKKLTILIRVSGKTKQTTIEIDNAIKLFYVVQNSQIFTL